VVLLNTGGNALLSVGMKSANASLIQSLLNPWVIGGIVMLVAWTLARMQLLSVADLSFVLPVTAIGYVLNALIGGFWLGEHISRARWGGTLLIMAGTVLAGLTIRSSSTTPTRSNS
jgi:drug/metabolite transporter (DMT)-like permease